MAPQTPAMARFVASVNAPVAGRDNLDDFDLEALGQLSGDERRQAEDLLIGRLDRDDGRVANALAAMGSMRAVEPLRRALHRHEPGVTRVAIARALTRLTGVPEGASELIETLSDRDFSRRASAANALGDHSGQAVHDALTAALDDPSPIVRGNALSSLYRSVGLAEHDQGHLSPLGLVRVQLMSELPAMRQRGAAEARRLLEAVSAGQSAQSLDLSRRVDQSADAIARYRASRWSDGDLDIDALTSLHDLEREWALTSLVGALADGDRRAPAALAAMGADDAEAILRQARDNADEPVREAIDRALKTVARSV